MSLPLKDRVDEANPYFWLAPPSGQSCNVTPAPEYPIPQRPVAPGEQYRFHFDMTKCIGCHCCEVACNEQNNNPAEINWRRVGEIEGGSYPFTQRFYLSMGCNHCLEPSCLTGCPVDAYRKDAATGLVLHSAETCIGCQYCIWNCPYGVPQYNPERGVVGKCDMCYGRLAEGREPACVNACPEGAIQIEIVNIAEWRQQYAESGNAPGLPQADETISTTRVTLPPSLPAEVRKADYHRVRPEHAHLPLVAMTVLTQLSAGAFVIIWLLNSLGKSPRLHLAPAAALILALLSLGASTLHLGRPIHAYRALKMWRRSWLSREVLLFSCFAFAASAYAGILWYGISGANLVGGVTAAFGIAGIMASASIYLVPARPAWNTRYTIADFYLTAALLGSLFLATPVLSAFAVAAAALQASNQASKFLWLIRSEEFELKASARLLSGELHRLFLLRFTLLVLGGIVLTLTGFHLLAVVVALAGELLGRYLFFVSVVPKNMAASFLAGEKAA